MSDGPRTTRVVLGWTLDDLRTRAESSVQVTCSRTSCLEPEVHELSKFVLALMEDATAAEARELRLAQALRVLRDTGSEYTRNVAGAALDEAGIADPDEDHL